MTDLEYSRSIVVAREPDDVYGLVSDITRMGEWSPICRACWWDDGAGPRVGAWFTGRNETPETVLEATGETLAARTWETRSQVAVADGKEFVWEVNNGWVRWGFAVEPADGGTRLTQSWAFLPKGIEGFHDRFGDRAEVEIGIRRDAAKSGIPVTLAAIKAAAEAA